MLVGSQLRNLIFMFLPNSSTTSINIEIKSPEEGVTLRQSGRFYRSADKGSFKKAV